MRQIHHPIYRMIALMVLSSAACSCNPKKSDEHHGDRKAVMAPAFDKITSERGPAANESLIRSIDLGGMRLSLPEHSVMSDPLKMGVANIKVPVDSPLFGSPRFDHATVTREGGEEGRIRVFKAYYTPESETTSSIKRRVIKALGEPTIITESISDQVLNTKMIYTTSDVNRNNSIDMACISSFGDINQCTFDDTKMCSNDVSKRVYLTISSSSLKIKRSGSFQTSVRVTISDTTDLDISKANASDRSRCIGEIRKVNN